MRRKGAPGVGRIVLRGVEIAVVALIIWAVVLLVQVPVAPHVVTTEQDSSSLEQKRTTLGRLMDQRREASMPVTAPELNAFLSKLEFEKTHGRGARITPKILQAQFGANELTVIVIGNFEVGDSFKKEFYLSYTGVPAVENAHFVFKPAAAAIGALPIHPLILQSTGFVQRYFGQLFRNLEEERRLLDKLTSISVNKQRVLLEYRPLAGN